MSQNIELNAIVPAIKSSLQSVTKYAGILFFSLIAIIYAFVLLRINTLSNAQPSDAEITSNATVQKLRVDKNVVEQIQQLQDNSVNVQSLFDNARSNPFQE
jgi:hypothetical protein